MGKVQHGLLRNSLTVVEKSDIFIWVFNLFTKGWYSYKPPIYALPVSITRVLMGAL